MKLLNKLGILGLFAISMVACEDQDPEAQIFPDPDVDFSYCVAGEQYTLDYYVVSNIQFTNTSAKEGNLTWSFAADTAKYEIVPDSLGNFDINNPIVKYKEAGRYDVTLTVEGVGSRTYPILIYDIVPMPSITSIEGADGPSDMVMLNDSKVSFDLRLPNPENLVVQYTWTFPEGTKDADGNEVTTFVRESDPETGAVETPQGIVFGNLGSQQVTIDAIFDFGGAGERQLEQSYINVQIASPKAAPTLYYAQVGGNIKAIKLFSEEELSEMGNPKVFPYDMGVSAGENPFNLLYSPSSSTDENGDPTHWIYILDAGKQYYYINDEGGVLGDGKITAMRTDGTNVNTVISNVGGAAFSDPFQGCVYNGYIYYNDRNRGFSKVGINERGLVEAKTSDNFRVDYIATNEKLGYYNAGISYGAISTGLYRDRNDVWWWGKNYSGNGIYRFKDEHVGTAERPYPIVLQTIKFTSYTLDEDRNKLYIWGIHGVGKGAGFVEYDLPALDATVAVGNATAFVNMEAKAVNTTADEPVYVKQLAVDARDGRVYFGYRAESDDVWTAAKPDERGTGLVYYNPETQSCHIYGETKGQEILGVVINPYATQLF